mgnify:CR=1 FL=1
MPPSPTRSLNHAMQLLYALAAVPACTLLTHAHAHTSARITRPSIQPYTHTLLPIKMLDVRVADLAIAVGAVWGLEQPVNWLGRTRWPVLAGHVQIAQSCVPPVCCGTPQHGSLSSFFSIRYNIDARRRLADGQPPHHTTHSKLRWHYSARSPRCALRV